jgi:hypothetical protein
MAHFFAPPGQSPVNFFHLTESRQVVARLWNVGGPKVKIVSDDETTATILSPMEVQAGIWEFTINGVRQGCSVIRAKNDQGHQWALTQAVVHAAPKAVITSPQSPDWRVGNFDSLLATDQMSATANAELTLNLRICLKQVPPGKVIDRDGEGVTTLPWPSAEWSHFTRTVQRDGQAFWDSRFWLRTPVEYAPLVTTVGKTSYRCNVRCRFKLELVPEGTAHQVIQVVYLDAFKGPKGLKDIQRFRGHMLLYAQDYIRYTKKTTGGFTKDGRIHLWVVWQKKFLHELGHSLGLLHIGEDLPERNPLCTPEDPDNCYGDTEEDSQNLMGGGNKLTPVNAKPWQRRIAQHTGTQPGEWLASMSPLSPVRL